MKLVANLKVKNKLLILVGLMFLYSLGSILFALNTVNNIKIGSPMYSEIKNLNRLIERTAVLKGDLNEVRVIFISALAQTDTDKLRVLESK
jgi:hypothetical protein